MIIWRGWIMSLIQCNDWISELQRKRAKVRVGLQKPEPLLREFTPLQEFFRKLKKSTRRVIHNIRRRLSVYMRTPKFPNELSKLHLTTTDDISKRVNAVLA
ncbi:hypothetical protein M7I_3274 [Glarea lozoyensis 74030]|uniref:Uncharacterized protein n=1 Tax=Glarea lozoyensis (strain ATCC 74030 / MF5533) TaxID=1104152 RepID=H0EL38_GLAL7|nr:hypothetical protein M7I_3274 [Glarea lozoyensis 74030]